MSKYEYGGYNRGEGINSKGTNMYQQQVNRVLEKVKLLNLTLAPVIELSKLQKIEEELNIQLPDSYKIFLTQVQNGESSNTLDTKGPYYGIYSIEEALTQNREWGIELEKDFQFEQDLELGDLYNAEEDLEKHIYRLENDAEYQSAAQVVIDKYNDTSVLNGSLFICEYGCGDFLRLVVTGKSAGQIWVDSGVINGTGFYSLNVDILTFYENWLNRKIEILSDPSKKHINAYYSFLEFGDNKRYQVVP